MGNLEQDIAGEIVRSAGLTALKLGLRFDRVVVRVLGDLRSFAEAEFPEASTFLVTITAPIRVPARTVATLKMEFRALAAEGPGAGRAVMVHGNRVRLRFVDHRMSRKPKLVGFVHNLDTDPDQLLQLAERWLRVSR